jgi:heme/copper-type cytochrome/quinol oxidase subunit 3
VAAITGRRRVVYKPESRTGIHKCKACMNHKAETAPTNHAQAGFNLVGFIGMIGFAVSAVSASFSITAILTWMHLAEKDLNLEGGSAFSAYFVPNLITLVGVLIGVIGLIITCISIATGRKRVRHGIDFIHILSCVFLTPAAYLFFETFFG